MAPVSARLAGARGPVPEMILGLQASAASVEIIGLWRPIATVRHIPTARAAWVRLMFITKPFSFEKLSAQKVMHVGVRNDHFRDLLMPPMQAR